MTPGIDHIQAGHCFDCGSTHDGGYMLHDALWQHYVGWRMVVDDDIVGPGAICLCAPCLEHRMGRPLYPSDVRALLTGRGVSDLIRARMSVRDPWLGK